MTTTSRLISADSHIIEPPDLYATRIEPRFRDRAPRMERVETPSGRKYDAWFIDGQQVGTLGAVMQAASASRIRRRSTSSASGRTSASAATIPTPW